MSHSVSKLHFFPSLRSCEHGCRSHTWAMALCPGCPSPLPPHRRPPSSALPRNIHSRPRHRALGAGSPPLGRVWEARPYKKACLDRNQPVPRQAESSGIRGLEGSLQAGVKGWEAVGVVGGQGSKTQRGLPSRAHEVHKEPFTVRQSQGPPQKLWGTPLGAGISGESSTE